jgi:Ca-activated chloride channel family protein
MSRLLLIAALPVLLGATVVAAHQHVSKDQGQTISVDVDLVLVTATVSDSLGRVITGLQPENFRIWEDKSEQRVESFSREDTPMSIGLIFDATGSMSDKISAARDAAASFLKIGNPKDEYFLVTFSQRPGLTEGFTSDISGLQNHMIFTPAKGLTPLFDAVYLG